MKIRITGYTKGLGANLYEHFKNKGYEVVGFNSKDSVDTIIEKSKGCDLFINNAYDDSLQLQLLHKLLHHTKKMIVCGSVAGDTIDENDIPYSLHKKELQEQFVKIASEKFNGNADLLLLKLTGDAYNNTNGIIDTIDFWLNNPDVNCVTFRSQQS
jgi:hypothetical protein|tara:strand:+ start:598 stop:1065 length:468 start_codon:yes stop_codon:yes gene_type:complete